MSYEAMAPFLYSELSTASLINKRKTFYCLIDLYGRKTSKEWIHSSKKNLIWTLDEE